MDEHTPLITSDAASRQSSSGPGVAPTTVSVGQGTVSCSVCGFLVPLTNNEKQIVVKCTSCGEATPIRAAPAEKQFIRCPCNCLLICSSSATRVACPRTVCQKIIDVSSGYAVTGAGVGSTNRLNPGASNFQGGGIPGGTFDTGSRPAILRVQCTCGHPFTVETGNRTSDRCNGLIYCLSGGTSVGNAGLIAARCPHCGKVTSVGPGYARVRMACWGLSALILLIVAIILTATTAQLASDFKWIYAAWAVLYFMVMFSFGKFCAYCLMPVSSVEVPVFRL